MTAQITDAAKAKTFLFGGNCRLTLVSSRTGARYTYKVQQGKESSNALGLYFVHLLTGSDNESDYTYIGLISGSTFRTTPASKLPADSAPLAAFSLLCRTLLLQSVPQIHPQMQVWHEGRCARCNRALTVPESIESGFGPECAKVQA